MAARSSMAGGMSSLSSVIGRLVPDREIHGVIWGPYKWPKIIKWVTWGEITLLTGVITPVGAHLLNM